MNMDTFEHVTGEIPVVYFQGDTMFRKKEYLKECAGIILEALDELDISRHEFEIHMCQGFIFSRAEEALSQQGWEVKRRRISGSVQYIVEDAYRQSVIDLGFERFLPIEQRMYERKRPDRTKELISRGKFRFFQFINWLQEDPEDRVKYVKTGWKTWSYWKHRIMSQADLRRKYKEMRNQRR